MGNYIGVNPINPKVNLGNGIGILLSSGSNTVGGSNLLDSVTQPPSGTTLGATVTSSANVIGFNTTAGVDISSDSNTIQANDIGTEPGVYDLGNTNGIEITSGTGNTIGGTLSATLGGTGSAMGIAAATSGNIIAFSSSDGVLVGAGSSNDTIVGNYIGTDPNGDALGNNIGVEINGASNNTIGSSSSGIAFGLGGSGANIISANVNDGIKLDNGANNNAIDGNLIGADSVVNATGNAVTAGSTRDATFRFGNDNGIEVDSASYANAIGGSFGIGGTGAVKSIGAAANVISGNSADGILFNSIAGVAGTAKNSVTGNVLALNSHNGIEVAANSSTTWNTTIQGNLIGIDPNNATPYNSLNQSEGNLLSGIQIAGNNQATISQNVISGNGLSGITLGNQSGTGEGYVQIRDNLIGTDATGTKVATSPTIGALPFGNVLDGIRVVNFVGVTIGGSVASGPVSLDLMQSGGNLISGNLGRGIELDSGAANVAINADLIGVVFGTVSPTAPGLPAGAPDYTAISSLDAFGNNTGNLSDGVFVEQATGNRIQGNVISANRGYGVHVFGAGGPLALNVSGDFIGMNQDGLGAVVGGSTQGSLVGDGTSFGNGADGIFVDSVNGTTSSQVSIANDVISGNHANGVDLLKSSVVSIVANLIGTDANGQGTPGSPGGDFGNASNGVFINQSSSITVGGALGSGSNVISGNHGSGVFVSGSSGSFAQSNLIEGNYIGYGPAGEVPNAVAGIILSNANSNMIGGAGDSGNIISGNSLDGILLVNTAEFNNIEGNLIGTDISGTGAVPNSADGILLLGGSIGVTIKGVTPGSGSVDQNRIAGNVISGNGENGIQIFGAEASGNQVLGNTIGLAQGGSAAMGNQGNGIYLNNDGGGNVIGQLGDPNVISGNSQSGILIFGTAGNGGNDRIVGNVIGVNSPGTQAMPNGGDGVFIYGTPNNSVLGNIIAGNAQAGIEIFTPVAGASAQDNTIGGNYIGVGAQGTNPIGNAADGVQILSAQDNIIGPGNVISANLGNGILIAKVSTANPIANTILGDLIGVGSDGSTALGNLQNGILVDGGWDNTIGAVGAPIAGTSAPAAPSNVISGNAATGVEFAGTTHGNVLLGNYIGVARSGTQAIPNASSGVFVDNLSTQPSSEQIGLPEAGAGNIIGGSSTSPAVNILGPSTGAPAQNAVLGNLIGVGFGSSPLGDQVGVLLQNSAGNTIGGPGAGMNVISGNSQAGVYLTGLFSTQELIQYNDIGTMIGGSGRAGQRGSNPIQDGTYPVQTNGVSIVTPSPSVALSQNNLISRNVISGNLIGINITGVGSGSGTGQDVPVGRNVITNNLIGTDATGNNPDPNFEYGVYINNSSANTIGGSSAAGNLLSDNGVDGVEIFGGVTRSKSGAPSARNVVSGNTIGTPPIPGDPGVTVVVPDGPTVTLGQQLYGVAVIGSSSNQVGTRSVGNTIRGNIQAGVYITLRDFQGNTYSQPTNNTLNSNQILANGIYGVYRYESPGNLVAMRPQRHPNIFRGNPVPLADFIKTLNSNTQLPRTPSKYSHHHGKAVKVAKHRAAGHHGRAALPKISAHHEKIAGIARSSAPRADAGAGAPQSVRPRVPALFRDGIDPLVIAQDKRHHGR
ncbi:MAG: beta strand repeat-containing protein [Isosphaeraceae bacterium]